MYDKIRITGVLLIESPLYNSFYSPDSIVLRQQVVHPIVSLIDFVYNLFYSPDSIVLRHQVVHPIVSLIDLVSAHRVTLPVPLIALI